MIWYSDSVVSTGQNVVIDLYANRRSVIGNDIHIYKSGESVYNCPFSEKKCHIVLPPITDNMEYYTVVISDSVRRISLPYTAMRLCSDDKYIICDIDFTISATNPMLYLMRKIVGLKTIGNSVDILRWLAEKYRIIYVTGRVELYTKMSHIWLENNGYPIGPILARPKDYPLKLADFKSSVLHDITAISKHGVGIGDLKSDIEAYMRAGIIPIRITHPFRQYKSTNTDVETKNGYYQVRSWYGIEKMFRDEIIDQDKE